MPSRKRWPKISELEDGNATNPIRGLAEHTAEGAAIAFTPYAAEPNRSTRKSIKGPTEKDDTEHDG